MAASAGLAPVRFRTRPFGLVGYRRAPAPGAAQKLRVYVEGDGRAWLTRRRASSDPTPEHPLGLALAARDPGPAAVLYLARPCQYVGAETPPCSVRDWTHGRFSEAVVASIDGAIGETVRALGAREVELVGYSGGGVVAALVAARRNDVARVVTVAAPLDPDHWTREAGATPLYDSLNPVAFAASLRAIPQTHFVGARDTRVPRGPADAYVAALGSGHRARVVSLPDFDHRCCWEGAWPALLTDAGVLTPTATPARP